MHNTTRHLTGETIDSYLNGTLDSNQYTILFLVQNDSFQMLLYYKSLFEEASNFFFLFFFFFFFLLQGTLKTFLLENYSIIFVLNAIAS